MADVFRSLELKLDLKTVLPLLEMLRAQVAAIEARTETAGQPGMDADVAQRSAAVLELHTLLKLFTPNFSSTATIVVSPEQTPAVLRACAYLRLGLRHGKLAAFSDATLEGLAAPADFSGEQRPVLMCYLFLATLQTVLLQQERSRFERWLGRIQNYFSPLRADYVEPPKWTADTEVPSADQSWQVVVLNDPVSLMLYVTTVFQLVLGLPPEKAHQHMREVHEAKQSIVFKGRRQRAEAHASALRAWYLRAEAHPAYPGFRD